MGEHTRRYVATGRSDRVPSSLPAMARTPVNVLTMSPWLDLYPNRSDAVVLQEGFSVGFVITFVYSDSPIFSDNLKSPREHPDILRQKVQLEVNLGRMQGPFECLPFHNLRISPLGVMPKEELGKFSLIHHRSHPKGASVIDDIPKESSSVSYVSFDRAVDLLRSAGQGALLAKSDIESGFRLLPIHPDCYHLLGCMMDDCYCYDTCLPMGCSISCHFFKMFKFSKHFSSGLFVSKQSPGR